MGILTWIIFGLIAGALAKLIMPGNQGMGWLMTIILGIVGAYVGAFVGQLLELGDVTGFNWEYVSSCSWCLTCFVDLRNGYQTRIDKKLKKSRSEFSERDFLFLILIYFEVERHFHHDTFL